MENLNIYRTSGKMKIDIDKHCLAVDLGFSADKIISEGFRKKEVSERDMLGFRTDVKSVLIAVCKKLVQKTLVVLGSSTWLLSVLSTVSLRQ